MTVRSLEGSPNNPLHCDIVASSEEAKDWRSIFERRWESTSATNILTVTVNANHWRVNLELQEGAISPKKFAEFIVAGGSVEVPSSSWSTVAPEDVLLEIAEGYEVDFHDVTRVKTDTVEVGCAAGMAILRSGEDGTVDLRVRVSNDVVRGIFDELMGD